MPSEEEVPLLGGMSTPGVVRVGDTVRRPMGVNADYVHVLLLHFERCGFDGAPRYLGVDRSGREILSFIDGFAPPHNGFELTEEAVRAGARLVREVHDLTQGTRFAADAEIAAHRNLSQPNFVFRDMIPIAIIDWDITSRGDAGACPTVVLDDSDPGEWGRGELDYMERNAPLFEEYLHATRSGAHTTPGPASRKGVASTTRP